MASVSFQKIDLDHPLFNTIFDKAQPGSTAGNESIESPTIITALQRQAGKSGHPIITLTDGSPFLSEHTLGNGKILFYSVSPVLAWSDFPLKGIFVPLIYRSILYTAIHSMGAQSFITGEDAIISLQQSAASRGQYALYAPDGTQELIVPANESRMRDSTVPAAERNLVGGLTFVKPHVLFPGFYELKSGTAPLAVFNVNIDGRESDTRKISSGAMEEFWKKRGIEPRIIPSADQAAQIQSTVLESRFGVELWKYLLFLSLILIIIEMIIAHDSREKQAPAV
jgi:hypothetical protein